VQKFISNRNGVRHSLEPRGVLLEFVVPEVTMRDARCDHEAIIIKRNIFAIGVSDEDTLLFLVDARHFAQYHRGVFLLAKNSSNRGGDLAGREADVAT
jgi:hypothetical protein